MPASPNIQRDSLRGSLQTLCFSHLSKLKATYTVLVLGNTEVSLQGITVFDCKSVSKEEKLKEVGDYLATRDQLARYLVRLDDDDFINTDVFDQLAEKKFDIAYDRKHFFYDLATGKSSLQKRDWIPNTAVHDYAKALEIIPSIGGASTLDGKNYLFACDHSRAWHPFYERLSSTHPKEPVYMRVLNPQSITALDAGSFSENEYFRYLEKFGRWNAKIPDSMRDLIPQLESIREKYIGQKLNFNPPKRFFKKWL